MDVRLRAAQQAAARGHRLRDRPAGGKGPEARDAALKTARIEAAAVLGFVAAVGACGGYLIPRAFAASIKSTGSAHGALVTFLCFYATCIGLTWAFYARRKPTSEYAISGVEEARV